MKKYKAKRKVIRYKGIRIYKILYPDPEAGGIYAPPVYYVEGAGEGQFSHLESTKKYIDWQVKSRQNTR